MLAASNLLVVVNNELVSKRSALVILSLPALSFIEGTENQILTFVRMTQAVLNRVLSFNFFNRLRRFMIPYFFKTLNNPLFSTITNKAKIPKSVREAPSLKISLS